MQKSILKICFFAVLTAGASIASAQSNSAALQGKAAFLIMGDSVMKTVSMSLERELAQSPQWHPVTYASIGSGLCRLDLMDWHAKIKTFVETEHPVAAVMLIGSNDNQPMQTEKNILAQGSEAWQTEYASRVGKCMDIMIQGGVKHVIWVALPDMREPDRQEHVLIINAIFAKEAASRPAVTILDTQKVFSREPGKFTMYVLGTDGKPLYVRVQDGIHFNREGANRLAGLIVDKLNALCKQD